MVAEIRRFSNYGRVVLKAWVRESPAPDFYRGLNIDPENMIGAKRKLVATPLSSFECSAGLQRTAAAALTNACHTSLQRR
jgi:hypothetical protein